ncbi:UNVERIFIED_CONTAM: hypothetical protein Slati_2362900 [Sesamum latifolium]|uniref:Secreted protein n=1 Tax=Sesamum latifolium TaxID=2727402 RepID=A0AAW2WAQ8_9LAMI
MVPKLRVLASLSVVFCARNGPLLSAKSKPLGFCRFAHLRRHIEKATTPSGRSNEATAPPGPGNYPFTLMVPFLANLTTKDSIPVAILSTSCIVLRFQSELI